MAEFMPFTKDVMFCEVMKDDKICQKMIEQIINKPLKKIVYNNQQQTITCGIGIRSIRLDVCVETIEGTLIDVEMQVGNYKDLELRFRGYQSILDSSSWKRGDSFDKLKDTYIIFLCLDDPFKKNLPIYLFEPICKQDVMQDYNFKIHWYALNSQAFKAAPKPINYLLEYINKGKLADDELVQMLNEMVVNINNDTEKVRQMTTVQNVLDESKNYNTQLKKEIKFLSKKLAQEREEKEQIGSENERLKSEIAKLKANTSN